MFFLTQSMHTRPVFTAGMFFLVLMGFAPSATSTDIYRCTTKDGTISYGTVVQGGACITIKVNPDENVLKSTPMSSSGAPVSGWKTEVLVRPVVIYRQHRRGASVQAVAVAVEKKLLCLKRAETLIRDGNSLGGSVLIGICNGYTRGITSRVVFLPETVPCLRNGDCEEMEKCVKGDAVRGANGVCGIPIDRKNHKISLDVSSDSDWREIANSWEYGVACTSRAQCPASFKCQRIRNTTSRICMNFHGSPDVRSTKETVGR